MGYETDSRVKIALNLSKLGPKNLDYDVAYREPGQENGSSKQNRERGNAHSRVDWGRTASDPGSEQRDHTGSNDLYIWYKLC